MSEINCNACNTLKETSPHFVQNGITDTECTSLAADTGLNPNLSPKHNDATDLHTMNDCLIGRQAGDLEKYNVCDWQDFMRLFIGNTYEMFKAIICALGGIWTFIHNILTRLGLLEQRVMSLEERMDAVEDDIANLKIRMTNAENRISNIEDDIDKIKSDVNTLKSDVSTLKSDMTGVKIRVTTLEGDMSNVKGRITTLEGDMSGVKSRLTTVEGKIENINSEISDIKTDVDGVKGRVGSLETTVSNHTAQISNLSNTVAGHTTAINSLSNTVAGHTTTINNLSNTVSSQASNISQNTSDIAALSNKLNNLIAALGGSSTTVPVMRRFRFTVPAAAFGAIWKADSGSIWDENSQQWYSYSPNGIVEWFSGAGNNQEVGEMWIRIPITEMESVTGVWTQTWVVPSGNPYDSRGKAYMQTVNVQEWYQDGDYIVINFDTFILSPIRTTNPDGSVYQNGGPYPVTVDFLVVGNKTFSPI